MALESETVAAQLAATTGIDSFVSKTKSMVALKKERWDKKASHTRVTEERKLLPNLVRLADYMLTASLTRMANANARRLLDAVEKPDPKSKGAFATVVGFGTETTQFEPDEQTLLTAINGQVLDALALALGSVPRVANARAFAPLFEGNAGDTTNEKRNLSVKRNLSLATPLGTPRASAQSIANTDSVESLEGGGGDPARGAGRTAREALQQLLAVGSVVLHPASTWRAYHRQLRGLGSVRQNLRRAARHLRVRVRYVWARLSQIIDDCFTTQD